MVYSWVDVTESLTLPRTVPAMGLDTVELVMEVEESFGISLPDDRASKIRTVGDLYAAVLDLTRAGKRNRDACLSAATFYSLRRHLLRHVPDVSALRPSASVDASLPRVRRRVLWARLADEMDLRFPALQRSPQTSRLVCLILVAATLGVPALFLTLGAPLGLAGVMALLTFIAMALMLALLTLPAAIYPDPSWATYRGLVTCLVAMNYTDLAQRHDLWSATEVWNVLQQIIVEQLGVSPEDVTPNTNFIHDLGAD